MIFLGVEEKRGLAKEKRGSSAALHIQYHFMEHGRNVSLHTSHPRKPPSAGGRTGLTRSMHKLWQPRWPTLREQSLVEATIIIASTNLLGLSLRYLKLPNNRQKFSHYPAAGKSRVLSNGALVRTFFFFLFFSFFLFFFFPFNYVYCRCPKGEAVGTFLRASSYEDTKPPTTGHLRIPPAKTL